jgi:hypothetical protein
LGLALGMTLGLAPLAWGTTLLCLLIGLVLRLPMAAVQAGNYAVYPVQLVLFLPFLATGQYLLASGGQDVLEQARLILAKDPLEFTRVFWQVNLRGLAVWLLVSPIFLWLAYRLACRLLPERDGS